jgi:hypothetical protein
MSLLPIIAVSINALVAILTGVTKLITNTTVVKYIDDAIAALQLLSSVFGGVGAEFEQGVKAGKYEKHDANLGGIDASKYAIKEPEKKSAKKPCDEPDNDADSDEELDDDGSDDE